MYVRGYSLLFIFLFPVLLTASPLQMACFQFFSFKTSSNIEKRQTLFKSYLYGNRMWPQANVPLLLYLNGVYLRDLFDYSFVKAPTTQIEVNMIAEAMNRAHRAYGVSVYTTKSNRKERFTHKTADQAARPYQSFKKHILVGRKSAYAIIKKTLLMHGWKVEDLVSKNRFFMTEKNKIKLIQVLLADPKYKPVVEDLNYIGELLVGAMQSKQVKHLGMKFKKSIQKTLSEELGRPMPFGVVLFEKELEKAAFGQIFAQVEGTVWEKILFEEIGFRN